MNRALGIAQTVAPTRIPPTNSTPNRKPPPIGMRRASIDGTSIFLRACFAAISIQRLYSGFTVPSRTPGIES